MASGVNRVWIGPAETSGTPLDHDASANWVEGGRVFSASDIDPQPQSRTDAMNRPVYTSSLTNAVLELVEIDKFNEVAAFDGSEVVLAMEKGDRKFRLYEGFLEVDYDGSGGAENLQRPVV